MVAGSNTSMGGGQAASEYNSGFFQFHYAGSGSTSNYIGFGLHGHDYLMRCYGTGNVSIGADNNNYKLYVNGTSYHNGNDTHAGNINPEAPNTRDLGSSTVKWANIYATTFHGALDGNAATATKLATPRNLKVKLDSTTAVTFDGNANQEAIPVTGTLPVANGGTGATTFTSGNALIGNGTGAITTRGIKDNTTVGNLGWTQGGDTTLVTTNTIAYWNGYYGNSNHSNLKYSVNGEIMGLSTA